MRIAGWLVFAIGALQGCGAGGASPTPPSGTPPAAAETPWSLSEPRAFGETFYQDRPGSSVRTDDFPFSEIPALSEIAPPAELKVAYDSGSRTAVISGGSGGSSRRHVRLNDQGEGTASEPLSSVDAPYPGCGVKIVNFEKIVMGPKASGTATYSKVQATRFTRSGAPGSSGPSGNEGSCASVLDNLRESLSGNPSTQNLALLNHWAFDLNDLANLTETDLVVSYTARFKPSE